MAINTTSMDIDIIAGRVGGNLQRGNSDGQSKGKSPRISVLMPTFNVAPFVEAAIRSVLSQSYSDIELVIQDDGSDDGTTVILRRLAAIDDRIVMMTPFPKNRGLIAARNSLLLNARGEFIAWMDADDTCAPQRLALQIAFLEGNPKVGAVGTAIEYADENMVAFRVERFTPDPRHQAVHLNICCATIMARRSVARKAGPFRDPFFPGGEDGDWLLRIADYAPISNIEDVLYTYRQHGSAVKRAPSAIRRLGVLARHAARVRRSGQPDPIDLLCPDPHFNYLSDRVFLEHAELSVQEKMTALGLPLPGHHRLISLLIPYYNARKYLPGCLDRLSRQTFRNFEVVIHDDGSQGPLTLDWVKSLIGDVEVRLVRSDRLHGDAKVRNRLLEMAHGKFVAWQNAYDYSSHERLERQLSYLLANPDCNGVGSAVKDVRVGTLGRSKVYRRQVFKGARFSGCCASFMLRKGASDAVKGFKLDLRGACAETNFLSRIKPRGSLHNLKDILYYPRIRGGQMPTVSERIDPEIYRLLGNFLHEYGLAPIAAGPISAAEWREELETLIRLRGLGIDGTQLAKMYTLGVLRDVRTGKRTWADLPALAWRFPRAFFSSVRDFLAYRGRLLFWRWRSMWRKRVAARAEIAVALGPAKSQTDLSSVRSASAPLHHVLTDRPARIVARCWDNWGDLDDAIAHLTPGGRGLWRDVAFVRDASFTPDWHIIFNHPGESTIEIEASPNRVIFAIGEPPTSFHRNFHVGQEEGTVVLTCDDQLVRGDPGSRHHILTPCMTRTWSVKKTYDELRDLHLRDKPRCLSWITSDLMMLKGHRYRLEFLERLQREIRFDLYGRGFQPIRDKWDGLAPYRYSLAFENTRAPFYFTEKLMDCFVAETMPIYFGSPEITRFFPSESMVTINPEDPDVFKQIREIIGSDLWLRRRDSVAEAKSLVLEKYNLFARLAQFIGESTDEARPPRRLRISPVEANCGEDQ